MRTLTAAVVPVSRLDPPRMEAMFRLYAGHYEAVTAQRFQHDLADKTVVLLLYDSHGELGGFSTLAIDDIAFVGRTYRVLFSGDTLIEPAYWGCHEFAFAWLRLTGRIKAGCQERPLIWFLIVKGHRTYRYLPAFSLRYYPCYAYPTPAPEQALLDYLARQRFGDYYDAATGLIRFPESRGHLCPELARIPEKDRNRPDVEFFLKRNPGYGRGDELACLCELTPNNLRPLARRLFAEGLQSGQPLEPGAAEKRFANADRT